MKLTGGLDLAAFCGGRQARTRLLTTNHNELLPWELTPDANRWAEAVATGDWVGFARKSLVRGFTTAECLTFLIDPCPTLEHMTTG